MTADTPADTASTTFPFKGNISFNADHSFALTAKPGGPGSITFYRAEGRSRRGASASIVPDGWTLTGITCTSATGASADRRRRRRRRRRACTLAAGGHGHLHVHRPAHAAEGGAQPEQDHARRGRDLHLGRDERRRRRVGSVTAQTTEEGVATPGTPDLALDAGSYTIREDLPEATGGAWSLDRVTCNGQLVTDVQPVTVTLTAGAGAFCTFTNRFTPDGHDPDPQEDRRRGRDDGLRRHAAVRARRAATSRARRRRGRTRPSWRPGTTPRSSPLGTYAIQETTPSESAQGYWTVDSVVCNGEPVGSAQGQVEITLTAAEPDADCTFTDRFTKGAEPPTPPTTDPDNPGGGVSPSARPAANLVITKRVSPTTITFGATARYTVTVTNRGPDTAEDVTVVEVNETGSEPLDVDASQGSCRRARPIVCRLGSMPKGAP